MPNKRLSLTILILALVAGIAANFWFHTSKPKTSNSALTLLQKLPANSSAKRALSQTNPKLIVVDFWASWCKPCVESLPYYQKLFATQPHIQFITINMDVEPEQTKAFLVEQKLQALPILFDRQSLTLRQFRLKGLPSMLIFDRHATEIARLTGFNDKQKHQLTQLIDQHSR